MSTLLCGGLGGSLWYGTRAGTVRTREVFAAVGWTWLSVTLIGAIPYILAGTFAAGGADFGEQLVNAVFEAASGFSCTGSTALTDFEGHGRGLLLYRQATQWYGGMGIVVLAVTVLPFLGVGGLDLITAEAPGPSSDRLAPRVSETARQLWIIYVLFTVTVVVVLFAIPGPSFYDSVAHALTTTSTGGFSPYGASIRALRQPCRRDRDHRRDALRRHQLLAALAGRPWGAHRLHPRFGAAGPSSPSSAPRSSWWCCCSGSTTPTR